MSLFKSASIVSLFTLVSRITGFIRDLLTAAIFGASALTDAFNIAFRIPNLFRRLFAEGAFSQAFVPVLSESKTLDGEEKTKILIFNVATILFWTLIIFCLFGIIFSPILVWFLAAGLENKEFQQTVFMTRWLFPYIGFMSLVALACGVLNTWKKFIIPAFTPVLLNLCMISALIILVPWFKSVNIEPIYAVVVGVIFGGILQLSIQIPALLKIGIKPKIIFNPFNFSEIKIAWQDSKVQKILKLMLPALLGVGVAQISLIINTRIASHLESGSVTWLFYADRLMEFPTALFGVALGVILTPRLSSAFAENNQEKYENLLDWGLKVVILFALPCSVALITFAKPLVTTLFFRGALTTLDVENISLALQAYGIGLLGLVSIKILASGYFAKQDMKTPVKIAIISLICTQILNLIFVPIFAHVGLALSIGLTAIFNAGFLFYKLNQKVKLSEKGQKNQNWFYFLIRIFLACSFLAFWLLFCASNWDWLNLSEFNRFFLMFFIILISVILYFVILLIIGVKLKCLVNFKNY